MSIKDELITAWKLIELKQFASELQIPNRSKMNKSELVEAINLHIENV